MSKKEFVDRLRTSLNGRVASESVADHIKYYEEYIDTEMQRGRSEDDILGMLGDPRLIARTIIDTSDSDVGGEYRESSYQSSGYQDTGYSSNGSSRTYESQTEDTRVRAMHMPGWLWTIFLIVAVIVIFSIVLSVLSFLAPVLLAVLVVMFLVKLFRDWLN